MDRVYRFSIPGITLLIVFAFYTNVFIGTNIVLDDWKILFPALLASPVLGLFFSSIITGYRHLKMGKNGRPYIYNVYLKKNINQSIFTALLGKDTQPKNFNEWKSFYWKYQSFIRENVNGETLRFTAGRWSTYNIYWNNVFCIAMGFVFSLISLLITSLNPTISLSWDLRNFILGIIGVIILLIYIFMGYPLAEFAKDDAVNVEYLSAKKALKRKTKVKQNLNPPS
jgi:hypothetical protein